MAQTNPYEPREITINIPVTSAEADRLLAQERSWTAPKLILLCAGTLFVAFIVLYVMSSSTAEAPYPNWLLP
jgi:hypothetical protein